MIILAFDTSVAGCSVCVFNGHDYWTETQETERGQAEMLVPMINRVLETSGYSFSEIARIGITTGPGSFTGLRVGLSAARAMALTLDKPLLGFSTLEVLAQGIAPETLILIDTKRGDYYGQIFEAGLAVDDARIWTIKEVDDCKLPIAKNATPDIRQLAHMARASDNTAVVYELLQAPEPVYLRGAEISQSKRVAPRII